MGYTATDSFHVVISKCSPAKKIEDITTIYARYCINREGTNIHYYPDMGRKMAFQKENTAAVLYTPKIVTQEINSLKLTILIDNQYHSIVEIRTREKKLEIGDEIPSNEPIFVNLHTTYCAFYPLIQKKGKVRIEQIGTSVSISLINYEGETRHFAKKDLKMIPSGFVCEIRNREEVESFENFILNMGDVSIEDTSYANAHTRYTFERILKYKRGERSQECSYSPVSEGIRYIRGEGKLLRARE